MADTELRPAWQVQEGILNGTNEDARKELEDYFMETPDMYIPVISVEVQRSIVPEEAKQPLARAFIIAAIYAAAENCIDNDVVVSVAKALRCLGAQKLLKSTIENPEGEISDDGLDLLKRIAEKMGIIPSDPEE